MTFSFSFRRFITFDIVDSADLRSEKVVMGQAVFDLETLDTEKGFQGKLKLADLVNILFFRIFSSNPPNICYTLFYTHIHMHRLTKLAFC